MMKKQLRKLAILGLLAFALPAVANSERVCVPYTIECDNGTFSGEICGETTTEIISKAWAIAEIVC
ncbi:hypothetical protein [Perlabentimonas gracilis]|jgi:hypothetical protein|uniref:hypothetical protein n=1 Tax=Perlabentimonas gracilis TaxID=2715279 RepID=UPI0014091B38|nr:hypothetical protein [Perlabentimonas gracilis]